MAFITNNYIRLYYRHEGRDNRPVIMFAHSLGVDHGQWAPQATELQDDFQVLRHDLRGHGASDAPDAEYSIETLGRDALALADALGIRQFAFCGLSIGGMIGQWLGANAGGRITRLILANTSPKTGDPASMEQRRKTVLADGMPAIVDAVLGRFFTAESREAGNPYVATTRRTVLACNPVGYAGCAAAVRDMDQMALMRRIAVPTLVIGGEHDQSTPWESNGAILAATIPGARKVLFPTAHLSNLEHPREFTAALRDFLRG